MTADNGRLVISWSELDTWRQCPFKHFLAYDQRWQGPVNDNSALGKGSLYHVLLETHYRTIKAHQITDAQGHTDWDVDRDTLADVCLTAVSAKRDELAKDGHDVEVLALVMWMYVGYVEQYGLDEEWDIIEVESAHVVPLLDAEGNDTGIDLKLKLDLLIKWRGRLWIVDHKSCGNLPTDKDFDWDDQFSLYMMALRRKMGLNIHGTIHSASRTKQNEGDKLFEGDPGYKKSMKPQTLDQRFRRTLMSRTDKELAVVEADALADALLAYSPANHRRRRPNTDTCKWRCGYQDACHFGRVTGDDSNVTKMLEQQGMAREEVRN